MNTALNLSSKEKYDQGQEYFNTIVHFLESEECHSMKLSGLEQELEKKGRELMRILLQEYLNKLSPNICEQPVRGSDDIERPKARSHERYIETVFGTVSSDRIGYGNKGVDSLHPSDACATYLKNKAPYLKYDLYLANGFPIATGGIEGACRHLVKDRMDITGAKWRLTSAEAVLRLRALRSSKNFDEYWNFHEACEYKRNHQNRYADGEVPPTKPPQFSSKGCHLKILKGGKM